MALGLEVFDSAGNQIIKVDDRLTQVVGVISLSSASGDGSIAADLSGGQPFAVFQAQSGGSIQNKPTLSFSTTGVSWSYKSTTSRMGGIIIYGIH